MCIRLYRHYTECDCLLATGASFRKCYHGPTSPLCGPRHTTGIVTRKGEECPYHARLTKKQRHAPEQSSKPRFRKPSGQGVMDRETTVAKLRYLRSLDMRERLERSKAKGLKGSYRGNSKPKPRGGALAFLRQFDGTEYTGQHPYESTDFVEGDVEQQETRRRLRDEFLATIQKKGLFDLSDQFLSSAWDDDDDGFSDVSSEAGVDAKETTLYGEGAEPKTSSKALKGGFDIMTGENSAMEVNEPDLDGSVEQGRDKQQGVDKSEPVGENEGTLIVRTPTRRRVSIGH